MCRIRVLLYTKLILSFQEIQSSVHCLLSNDKEKKCLENSRGVILNSPCHEKLEGKKPYHCICLEEKVEYKRKICNALSPIPVYC